MAKWLVIGGVVLLVLLLAKKAHAAPGAAASWDYLPDYRPGSGVVL